MLTDIGNDSLPLALAAAGGSLVVLTRGFDLSVAGVVSLTNVAVAVVGGNGAWGALEDAAIALGIGAVVGAVNGTLVAYFGLQSIALTLASMIACSGAALLILDAPGGTVSDFMSNAMVGDYRAGAGGARHRLGRAGDLAAAAPHRLGRQSLRHRRRRGLRRCWPACPFGASS